MPDTIDYATEDATFVYGDAAGEVYIAAILPTPPQPTPSVGIPPNFGAVTTFTMLQADVVNYIDDEILWRSGVPPTRR